MLGLELGASNCVLAQLAEVKLWFRFVQDACASLRRLAWGVMVTPYFSLNQRRWT